MMTIAAGRPLVDLLSLAYRARLPVLMRGRHGIGKSRLVEHAAGSLGIDCITLDLSLLEPPDLVGIPQVIGGKTRYAVPSILPDEGAGILLLEELNRAPVCIRAPCLQLLTGRRLNEYELPVGWVPCAAVNDANEGLYQVDDLDPALLSRFLQVHVIPDVQEWLNWARGEGQIHHKVIRFVENSPGIFDDPDANPRSWAYVSNLLREMEAGDNPGSDILSLGLAGLVGDHWAVSFLQTDQGGDMPLSASVVIGDYSRWRTTIQRWLLAAALDRIAATLENVKRHLQPQQQYKAVVDDPVKKENVENFFRDLPADFKRQTRNWLEDRGFTGLRVRRGTR